MFYPGLWLMTNAIANELAGSWKLVRFLQTLTEISSFKPVGTRNVRSHSWTWVEVENFRGSWTLNWKRGNAFICNSILERIKRNKIKVSQILTWKWIVRLYIYLPNNLFDDSGIVAICNLIDPLSNKNYLIHKFSPISPTPSLHCFAAKNTK